MSEYVYAVKPLETTRHTNIMASRSESPNRHTQSSASPTTSNIPNTLTPLNSTSSPAPRADFRPSPPPLSPITQHILDTHAQIGRHTAILSQHHNPASESTDSLTVSESALESLGIAILESAVENLMAQNLSVFDRLSNEGRWQKAVEVARLHFRILELHERVHETAMRLRDSLPEDELQEDEGRPEEEEQQEKGQKEEEEDEEGEEEVEMEDKGEDE